MVFRLVFGEMHEIQPKLGRFRTPISEKINDRQNTTKFLFRTGFYCCFLQ